MRTTRSMLLILFASIGVAQAGEQVMDLPWPPSGASPFLMPHTGVDASGIVVANRGDGSLTAPLLQIEAPAITGPTYALRGHVRFENVEGAGYLEMWSRFPDGGVYFSRTLDDEGPAARFSGSSDWRMVLVPFQRGAAPPPERLDVNVILPGRGRVELRDLELVQGQSFADLMTLRDAWWSDQQAGLYGGWAGGLAGLCGALIGILAGMGRARGLVLGLCGALIGVGGVALGAGIVALVSGQPYAVFYPLLLLGIILVAVFGFLMPVLRRRFHPHSVPERSSGPGSG